MPTIEVAIVTGAGQGIGRSIALDLAAAGMSVAVLDLSGDRAGAVDGELRKNGATSVAVDCDVSDPAQVADAIAEVTSALGRPTVLVNNAGVSTNSPFLEGTPAEWQRLLAVNYFGVVYMCHAALPGMLEAKHGRIINISSDAARAGVPGEAVYAGAKGAVISFSKSLAAEVARSGVLVNVVSPSTTDTPMMRAVLSAEQIQRRERAIPLGRVATPEDVARVVTFFASEASGYVTGQVLSVNGGSLRFG